MQDNNQAQNTASDGTWIIDARIAVLNQQITVLVAERDAIESAAKARAEQG
jgi:uncharacterized small protein (DUF1192 family)